jgi:hypothetical protein
MVSIDSNLIGSDVRWLAVDNAADVLVLHPPNATMHRIRIVIVAGCKIFPYS